MAKALYYPKANRTAQDFSDNFLGSLIVPDKVVWHTTETGGYPAYGGGATAPHCTYHADIHDWRQHFPANRSSRALRNEAGGVQTNTEDALQVEIVAYSDERLAAQRGHLPVSELDSQALDDLADFSRWANREWGVPLVVDAGWLYSNFNAPPMSHAAWRAFRGHTGHNRVPENTHWDPARLDIDEVIRRARGADEDLPDTGAPTEEDWFAMATREELRAEVRIGFFELIDEARNRSTPTGRQLGDDLNGILQGNFRVALHGLLDEAANRSTPTGRQLGDDIAAAVGRDKVLEVIGALRASLASEDV